MRCVVVVVVVVDVVVLVFEDCAWCGFRKKNGARKPDVTSWAPETRMKV